MSHSLKSIELTWVRSEIILCGCEVCIVEFLLILTLAADKAQHLTCMHGLHLLRAEHLRVLQVAQEVLHLISEESVSFDTSLLFFLLLDLQAVDFFAHLLLKLVDLPSHSLVENGDILH